jgi:hypothetical protein
LASFKTFPDASQARRRVRYAPNWPISFSFKTWKVSPWKSFFSNILYSAFRNLKSGQLTLCAMLSALCCLLIGPTFLWMRHKIYANTELPMPDPTAFDFTNFYN